MTVTMTTIIKRWLCHLLLGFVLTLPYNQLLVAGTGHNHGGGHGHDQPDHEEHDHSDEPALVYTHYTQQTELFAEFPPLVVNEPSTFIAHFTRMDNFEPLVSGVLNVHLKQRGKTVARFRVKAPARKGIFLPAVTAKATGDYQLVLDVRDGDLHAIHDLGQITVFPNKEAITLSQEEADGEISYLKEQQWENPFAIRQVQRQGLRSSVPGFATVDPPGDAYAVVRASTDGYFAAQRIVNAGEQITQDRTLGFILPRLGEGADIGNLVVAQERARSRFELNKADVERLQGLFKQGAIPEKRLQQAKQALQVARVELETARARIQRQSGESGAVGIALRAPITGELVNVAVRPGAFVRSGNELFTLASPEKRWLNIQVPEKFGHHIRRASGAWLLFEDKPVVLDTHRDAKLIYVAQQVEKKSRTVSLAIEYPTSIGPSLLGARFATQVYIGEPQSQLAIPASAVIDDGGRPVVYVQTGGETFARRAVTLGIRDGDWVAVKSGLDTEEWVVSDGAYYVKLASTGDDSIGHGHAH